MDIRRVLLDIARQHGIAYAMALQAALLIASECWDQSCDDQYGTLSGEVLEELAAPLRKQKLEDD